MLAPASMPVAAGKNTANTVKKVSLVEPPSDGLNEGPKLSRKVRARKKEKNKNHIKSLC